MATIAVLLGAAMPVSAATRAASLSVTAIIVDACAYQRLGGAVPTVRCAQAIPYAVRLDLPTAPGDAARPVILF